VAYTNLDGTTPDKGLGDILKWQLARKRSPPERPFVTPRRENDGSALRALTPHLTWIGHATFVQRLGGKLVVTDPIWRARLGPRARLTAPGVALEALPPVDLVTVSHSHYDHMDTETLARLGERPTYVVPRDCGEILRGIGLPKVVELDWWQTHVVDGLSVTLVPVQHWSMRVPWDKNRRLWGGFVFESSEGTSYHAGDTALSERVFRAIHDRFPRIDWAMLPIGAYEPRWFMQAQHMNPDDAGQAFDWLGARTLAAMHWGTFKLTDEPTGEPPERMRAYWEAHGLEKDRLWVFDVGETRPLVRA
jgi:L-ascorbate metabolism protein UlaG (beta-lactamase superfamily)